MGRLPRLILIPFVLLAAQLAACSRAPAPAVDPKPLDPHHGPRRFYNHKDFGSEAEFNPATEFLNEGFDILSLGNANRQVFQRPLGTDARNVLNSLAHPIASIDAYGWDNLLKAEILPTSFARTRTSGKWTSNYQLHMFGSGMVSLRMTDWYDEHGFAHPALLGQATTMAAHLMNEMSENGGQTTLNEDPVADIFIFDVAGFVLWHQHWMQRLFTDRMQLTNWPGQPTWNPATATLENTGQYFILRGPLPKTNSWRFFYAFGMSGSFGLSKNIGDGRALSVGLGVDGVSAIPATDSTRGQAQQFLPKGTIYYDREGSLLWSVAVGNRTDATRLAVNVYPGVLRVGGVTTGLWAQVPRGGGMKAGIVSTIGLGIGAGRR